MSVKMVKLLSLLIAVAMVAGIFAGCGAVKKEAAEDATTVNEASTVGQTVEKTEDQGYVPQKDLEITIWNTQGTDVQAAEKPKEDIPGDWLAQKTRVKVAEFYGNGGQQWEAKLTTLVASGNLPSLVLTQSQQGPAHHAKLHEGDLNWELTPEMLQKYAPDVWEFTPQYIWDSIKIDGKIYGIPYSYVVDREIDPTVSDDLLTKSSWPKEKVTWSGISSNSLIIRDDILKQLIPSAMNYDEAMALINEKNAPIGDSFVLPIKTTDEYIKFLYDIKALGLKEGNKPVYSFGYNGGDLWMALCVLGAEMMGYKEYYYTGFLNVPEKKMDFGYLNPAFKEAGVIQNKMINDKVIDPESLMHNAEKFKEKVMNGQYAITWVGVVGSDIDTINSELEKAGKKFKFVPFYTQVPQSEEFPAYKEGPPTFIEALSLLKTLKEDEVPQILNWINTMFTEEWEEVRCWGPKEAGLYEELPDGTRKFKDEKMNKRLVDNDETALDWRDAKGFINNFNIGGGAIGAWYGVSRWVNGTSKYSYAIINNQITYKTLGRAMKFPSESPWCQEFELVPNIQSWSAEYANIPEIQKLWATRATWDDPFKIAFTARNEEEFSKKWDAAIENFKKTIDVDKMLEEQTKIMLPLLEKRAEQAK